VLPQQTVSGKTEVASQEAKRLGRVAQISPLDQNRVPYLRDGFIVAKVGHFRGSENPDNSPERYPKTRPSES
jgi:hypothetical protein